MVRAVLWQHDHGDRTGDELIEVIQAYLREAARGQDHQRAVRAAAEAVAADPWRVVIEAGRLARGQLRLADRDLGLSAALSEVAPNARNALVRIDRGQPYPTLDTPGRRRRGAFDTPPLLARRVVRSALAAVEGTAVTCLDTACGTGAFLVAMAEAGLPEVYGTDLDPVALEVARVACPRARVAVEDALRHGPQVDLICGNPPFVPPERQDRALRDDLKRRFPWLRGRFDLVVPFAATAVDRVRVGGGVGLVLPSPMLVQPYATVLRRRWLNRHRFLEISAPMPFPGASVEVSVVVLQAGRGRAPLPDFGIQPDELLRLPNAPLDPLLAPGDVRLSERVRAVSVPLGELCVVDTGVVAHGPAGGKARLLHDAPGEGRVPYADAKEFFAGERRWLDYQPDQMHRSKRPELFAPPKIVVQRLRGRGPVKARVDRTGIYVGHTCSVVVPRDGAPAVDLDRLCALVTSPLIDGLLRIEQGQRLDLYPRDLASIPVPRAWFDRPGLPLEEAFGLDPASVLRLTSRAAR